ncbi:MAG: GNAT family N-acetyltransferase [Clostridia bacterium]|nr:GNAT family N-acetyltransferase [Clostridia bacterium]
MFIIAHATLQDKPYWYSLDRHMPKSEYEPKVRDKRCYILRENEQPIGILRYNLFWDVIPFLTLIFLEDAYHRKGLGSKAMAHWENEMGALGHKMVMTSTQADEKAQFFYRKLGYKDMGCLVMNDPPYEQPLEVFLSKGL